MSNQVRARRGDARERETNATYASCVLHVCGYVNAHTGVCVCVYVWYGIAALVYRFRVALQPERRCKLLLLLRMVQSCRLGCADSAVHYVSMP